MNNTPGRNPGGGAPLAAPVGSGGGGAGGAAEISGTEGAPGIPMSNHPDTGLYPVGDTAVGLSVYGLPAVALGRYSSIADITIGTDDDGISLARLTLKTNARTAEVFLDDSDGMVYLGAPVTTFGPLTARNVAGEPLLDSRRVAGDARLVVGSEAVGGDGLGAVGLRLSKSDTDAADLVYTGGTLYVTKQAELMAPVAIVNALGPVVKATRTGAGIAQVARLVVGSEAVGGDGIEHARLLLAASSTEAADLDYQPLNNRVVLDKPLDVTGTLRVNGERVDIEELIDTQTLTSAASYATPTFADGFYKRLRMRLDLTSFAIATLTFNSFAGSTGRCSGTRIGGTAFSDSTAMYLHYQNSPPEQGWLEVFIDLDVPAGCARGGKSLSSAVDVATGLIVNGCSFRFHNSDVTTAILGCAVAFGGSNATGTARLWGVRA